MSKANQQDLSQCFAQKYTGTLVSHRLRSHKKSADINTKKLKQIKFTNVSRTSCEEEGAERRKHTLARVSQDFLDDTSALITDSDFGITDICTLERASGTFQSTKKCQLKKILQAYMEKFIMSCQILIFCGLIITYYKRSCFSQYFSSDVSVTCLCVHMNYKHT